MRALEPIYAALYALGASVGTASGSQTPFTPSRRWVSWDQEGRQSTPSFFQMQKPIRVEGGPRGLPVFRLPVDWYLYFSTDASDLQTVTATTLNNYLTALINAVWPIGGQKQTLGGLASDVSIDGDIIIDEGVVSPPAIICVPLVILTGF